VITRETSLWHPLAPMGTVKSTEIVIERAEGCYVWDSDGHRLLDAPASLWYCNIGHGRKEMAQAIARQVEVLETYHTFLRYANRPALELAERLVDSARLGTDAKIVFGSGGSDAIESACKLARLYWNVLGRPEKQTIIGRDRSYHGLHGFGTSIGGLRPLREGFGNLIPDVLRVETNSAEALETAIGEAGADTIAAFVAEPVVGGGGAIFPADGYLAEAQRICNENDVLFVADEVVTGFGRTGEFFASHRFGIEPDLIAFAKGITSGYVPLGGLVVSGRVAEPFWTDGSTNVFRHGVTYAGHATACAAGLANLEILERERLIPHVRELEPVLIAAVEQLRDHPAVAEVRCGAGLIAGVRLADPSLGPAVAERIYADGVIPRLIGDADVLQISPPFVINEEELRSIADVFTSALDSVSASAVV